MYVINMLFAFNNIFNLSMNYDYPTYLEIVGGDSDTIYRAVMDVLEEYHVLVPLHKVINWPLFRWGFYYARGLQGRLFKAAK